MSWFLASMSPRSMRLAQRHLLLGREQRHLADLAQVHAHGVVARRLDGEVELGHFALGLRLLVARARLTGFVVHAVGPDHVDAEVVEGHVHVVDLLGREVDVGEDLEDVLGGEVALLLALVEQQPDLLDRAEDRVVGLTICC